MKYSLDESWKFFGKAICPECGEKTIFTGKTDEGWAYLYECIHCESKFKQQAAATGQDPWLTKIN